MRQRPWKPRGHLHRVLRRSGMAWWTAALSIGLVTAFIASTNLTRATNAASAWGVERPVWVVQRNVAAGRAIDHGDVVLSKRPKGVVPTGALTDASSPVGATTRVALVTGEVLVAARVAGRGTRGLAALIGAGRRAVAMKNDEAMPALRPGDRVDVIATFDVANDLESAPSGAPKDPSFAVAVDAEVLAATARTITLSVRTLEAPKVAFALARAAVTVVLRP